MPSVGTVILAAGASRRLGEEKQFLRHQGETLIHRSVRAACEAGLRPCVIVSGNSHARLQKELAPFDVMVSHHQEWERGIGSSLRSGVEHALEIQPHLKAIVTMVCDQPFISAEILRALVDTFQETGTSIAACAYEGTIGVPALFARPLFKQLLDLPDTAGAKTILMKLRSDVIEIDFPLGAIDIDTPEDRDTKLQPDSLAIRLE